MMSGRVVPQETAFQSGIRMKGITEEYENRHLFTTSMKKVIFVSADACKGGSFFNRNVFIVYNGGMQRHREAAIMYIEWTETAAGKIAGKVQGQEGYLQLKYDTDGCGCVVSGVTALWWVNEPEEGAEKGATVVGSGVMLPELEAQLFQYGRYLLIASSRGPLPANLQGLEEIRFKTNLIVEPVVVENDKLTAAIHKLVEASGAAGGAGAAASAFAFASR